MKPWLLILACFVLFACKHRQKVVATNASPNPVDTTNSACRLDYKSAHTLSKHLKANELNFQWLSAKLKAKTESDSLDDNDFTVSLRIRKDSAIWLSISKLAIEGMRILITRDSVKFIDQIHSQYFTGDFNYINTKLQTELDFEIVQALLVGNSVEFYDEDERLRPGVDRGICQYILGTVRKRQIRRFIQNNKEVVKSEGKEPLQSIWLRPDTWKIARVLFHDFATGRNFTANYSDYRKQDSLSFPFKLFFEVKAEKNISISVEYHKVTFNEQLGFPFNIPKKYERVYFREK